MISEIPAGTLINNRYLIDKLLGQGGFGRTYLAFDKHRFGETCVLKEFVPATTQQEIINKSKELFEREAKVLYQIEHPQIPKFLASVTDGKRLFIVQEYIDGKTYSQILCDRISQKGKAFSEDEVKTWLQGILPILEYIHQRKIIHRDISLDNIMLPDCKSQPVLIDFGVVKEKLTQFFSTNSNNSHYSLQGSVVGKIGYSPPEQLRLGQCYPSSDLYALAVCAIVLLTGRMPYLLIDESLNWQWQRYTNVSKSFAKIIDKMLVDKPSDRFQSANDILLELSNQNQPNQSAINQFIQKTPFNIFQKQKTQSKPQETHTNSPSFTLKSESPTKLHPQAPISINTEFLDYCKQELISFVGPFATVLMQHTLDKSPHFTAEQFIDAISDAIPNEERAKEFRNKIKIPTVNQSQIFNNSINEISVNSHAYSQQSVENNSAINNPEFLKYCHQELTSFIGPVAKVILEDTLAKNPELTTHELIETLVSEIPSTQRAKEFKESIGKYIICT
ncbi:serine/threonine-protein kinase [Brunnivagina elsteri]|uniref:non-specific serine/threonine protein kinase n=1 Tax=Brunnivagina elsteri CCALA 953 TaxID=987040 RepID=A0A2A2TI35_9CYAN|nr:serine/threonine-protein kinase [Calothrix elsteri]PAX53467.1 serine/threonine protein kinase [Calothrix elsteri CCALA 953]